MKTYKIIGITADGRKIDIAMGYISRGHCYASATKMAIDLCYYGNPLGIVRVGLRTDDDELVEGYPDNDHNLLVPLKVFQHENETVV